MPNLVRSPKSNPTKYVWRWTAGAKLRLTFASFATSITAMPSPAIPRRGYLFVSVLNFSHLDYGYAVTSHSSQGLTFDRVLINADTRQSVLLLNDRTAYVAISRARYDALIYTDSTQNLSDALNREINKTTALEAVQANEREVKRDRDELRQESPSAQQHPLPFDHDIEQSPTHIEPAQTQPAPPAIESRNSIARATNETLIRTDSAQNLS